jgi:hypothetical protein
MLAVHLLWRPFMGPLRSFSSAAAKSHWLPRVRVGLSQGGTALVQRFCFLRSMPKENFGKKLMSAVCKQQRAHTCFFSPSPSLPLSPSRLLPQRLPPTCACSIITTISQTTNSTHAGIFKEDDKARFPKPYTEAIISSAPVCPPLSNILFLLLFFLAD